MRLFVCMCKLHPVSMAAADTMMAVSPMGEGGCGRGCGEFHHDRLRAHQHHFKHRRPHPLFVPPPDGSDCPLSCGPPRPFGRHHHPGRHRMPHHSCPHVMVGDLLGSDDQDPTMAPPHHHHPGPPAFGGFLGPHLHGPPAFGGFLGPHFHHPGHHFYHRHHGRVNPNAHDVGGLGPAVVDCSSSGSEGEDCLHPEPRTTDASPLEGPATTETFDESFPPPPPPPPVPMHMMMMMHWGHAGRFMHAGELPLHHEGSETPHDSLSHLIRGANPSSGHDLEKALRIRLLRHGGRRMRRHGGRRCSSVPHDAPHSCHPHPDAAIPMRGHSGEACNIAVTSAPINEAEIPKPTTVDEGVDDTNDALALMALNDTIDTAADPSH